MSGVAFEFATADRVLVGAGRAAELPRVAGRAAPTWTGAGGGSAIDFGKAVAMLLGNGGDPLDRLEVVGCGRPITCPAVPWVALLDPELTRGCPPAVTAASGLGALTPVDGAVRLGTGAAGYRRAGAGRAAAGC